MIFTKEILSIDLGKFNSVFCLYDPESKKAEFRTVLSSPDQVRQALLQKQGQTVVMEACSQAGWVSDLSNELGLQVTVASTTGAAWQWKHVKRKIDRDDALKLARIAAVGEIQAVSIPPKEVRQRKSLIGLRKRLVGERIRGLNRIRGLLSGQGLSMPRGAKAWTAEGIIILQDYAKPLVDCQAGELYRGELSLLLIRYQSPVEQIRAIERTLDAIATQDPATTLVASVPGIGPRTAEVIATSLGDARRFRNADEVSAYAGLVPRQYQSGETDRRGRITKRGSKVLRRSFVDQALSNAPGAACVTTSGSGGYGLGWWPMAFPRKKPSSRLPGNCWSAAGECSNGESSGKDRFVLLGNNQIEEPFRTGLGSLGESEGNRQVTAQLELRRNCCKTVHSCSSVCGPGV